jgi:hypothetical protein
MAELEAQVHVAVRVVEEEPEEGDTDEGGEDEGDDEARRGHCLGQGKRAR